MKSHFFFGFFFIELSANIIRQFFVATLFSTTDVEESDKNLAKINSIHVSVPVTKTK